MTVLNKITAWSYSRWNDYTLCPLKAKLKYVDKLKEPGSIAMDRGSEIHTKAEQFIKGTLRTLDKALKIFSEVLRDLKKSKANAELEWAFTKAWTPTGWFAKDAWCRIKVDVFLKLGKRARVIDWKTGKLNPDHMGQLSLYALGAFLMDPEIEEVSAELCYLDHPIVISADSNANPVTRVFKRSELPGLKKDWEKATKKMLMDAKFAPRPNDKCRWCHWRKENGGPCKF